MNNRLNQTKNLLTKNSLDAILVSSIPNITYLTGFSNFSKDEREAFVVIVAQPLAQPQGLTHKTPGVTGYIITDGRYSEAVQISVPHFELIERNVNNTLKQIFSSLLKKHRIKTVGIEENNICVAEYKAFKKLFPRIKPFDISLLRTIKSNDEIKAIEKACEIGDKAFEYILEQLNEDLTEKDVAFLLEHFIKKQGADLSFPTIVAFGKNSSIPHHQTSNQRLASSGQFVLIDFGVKLNNYCSDMTRTVFFGKATDEQKKMYQTVLEAQQKAIDFLTQRHSERSEESPRASLKRSGSFGLRPQDDGRMKASDIDKVARDYIVNKGYPTIPHSLGHGIGLEVHEAPRLSPNSSDELREGMVFSIEPGIYLPGFGGVRIEDLIVLEKSGHRSLTKSPRGMIII
ncbi:MAG: aminopeptidase P family protein [Candidatus Levybacteria bacterium]|nr:aminopeptidase P family protein [Candidatus Levybacteria bacterium]